MELQVRSIKVVSRAAALPFEVVDAARSDAEVASAAERGEVLVTVSQDSRLDNRFLDLRTPANQAIFRLQSAVCQVGSVQRGWRVCCAAALRAAVMAVWGLDSAVCRAGRAGAQPGACAVHCRAGMLLLT